MIPNAIPNEKFRYEVTQGQHGNVVFLYGVIDEDTVFDELKAVDGPLVFNFRNVASINSCGIRTWVNFLKELEGKTIYYEECPPLIVRQMNMVPSFMGNAQVLSVFVPYVCDNCETEDFALVQGEQLKQPLQEAFPCNHCGQGEMELDGHPQQYLAFSK